MAIDITNFILPQPPVSQTQPQNVAPSTQEGQSPSDQAAPSSPDAAQNTQSQTPSTPDNNNTGANASDTHFGKLLTASQNANGNAGSQPADTSGSGQGATLNTASAVNVIAALVLSELQTGGTADAGGQATLAAATPDMTSALTPSTQTAAAATASQGDPVLQMLLTLLQQVPAAPQVQNSPAPATGSDTASSVASTPQANTAQGSGSALTQALGELSSLLQNAASQLASGAAATGTAPVAADSGAPSPAALLAQLTQLLQEKLGAAATQNNALLAANAATNASAGNSDTKFAALLASLTQISGGAVPTSDNLASNLSQMIQALTILPDGKTGSGDTGTGSGTPGNNGGNTQNSSSANTQAPGTIGLPSAASQASASDFVKFLPAASSTSNVADQVIVQIRNAASTGASQIRIQLEPADLGRVEVQMVMGSDGKTGVTITADNRQTLSMLQSEARSLESALRDIGLKTDTGGLSFNLRGEQQNPQGNNPKQGGYTQVAAIDTTEEDMSYYGSAVGVYRLSAEQGLDIRV